ncbi:hypothetical protein ACRRTK_009869 [Alexandromys fortis]
MVGGMLWFLWFALYWKMYLQHPAFKYKQAQPSQGSEAHKPTGCTFCVRKPPHPISMALQSYNKYQPRESDATMNTMPHCWVTTSCYFTASKAFGTFRTVQVATLHRDTITKR